MMNDDPRVSVIVPVYNSAGSVEASLGSLFGQTLGAVEVIAVNDASSDGSAGVLDRIAGREPRLRVIHLAQNVGVHEARAAGLRAARAPWIGFLDADDIARPAMYAELHGAAERWKPDICVCGSERVTAGRKRIGPVVRFTRDAVWEKGIFAGFCNLHFGNGALWNKLYRAELIRRWGTTAFRWRQDATEDTLVNIGCFLGAGRVCLLKSVLHEYVCHPASATRTVSRAAALVRILRAYAVAIDTYGGLDPSAPAMITTLYRRQLRYDCYHVASPEDLLPLRSEVAEAMALLARLYPEGLAALASRIPAGLRPVAFRGALRAAARAVAGLPGLFASAVGRRLKGVGSGDRVEASGDSPPWNR